MREHEFYGHGTLVRTYSARMITGRFCLPYMSLVCYAADSGNRYSPEDALIPGSYPGEGSPYGWSAVVNSVLQPTLGLRWGCFEENNRDLCHLQKAAPSNMVRGGREDSGCKLSNAFRIHQLDYASTQQRRMRK